MILTPINHKCPICDSTDSIYIDTSHQFGRDIEIHRCVDCGWDFVYEPEEMPWETFWRASMIAATSHR